MLRHRLNHLILLLTMGLPLLSCESRKEASEPKSMGNVMDFALLDRAGTFHRLSHKSDHEKIYVISYNDKCVGFKLVADRARKLAGKNEVLFIDSSKKPTWLPLKIVNKPALVLNDTSQAVSQSLGFKNAYETLVLDHRKRILERLDLRPPGEPCPLEFESVKEEGLAKRAVEILQQKCLNCHAQGQFPPNFETLSAVRSWSAMSRETILNDRMPPFSGDPRLGPYKNDISLSDSEKRDLLKWFEDGAPRGDKDQFKPPKVFGNKEALKKLKFLYNAKMNESIEIPPNGILEYQYHQLGGPLPEEMNVRAIDFHAKNPRQLHHVTLYGLPKPLSHYLEMADQRKQKPDLKPGPDGRIPLYVVGSFFRDSDLEINQMLRRQIFTWGMEQPNLAPEGLVTRYPKGWYLAVEAHYMGTGKSETEQIAVDFYGPKEINAVSAKNLKGTRSLTMAIHSLKIPPGESDFVAKTKPVPVTKALNVYQFMGHLHMRGRWIKVVRINPDKSQDVIVSMPNYYYGWQTGAGLKMVKPIHMPAGSAVYLVCGYDNSAANPYNPDPKREVWWGQSLDKTEMCHGGLAVADAD